jgi:hypothetical protein
MPGICLCCRLSTECELTPRAEHDVHAIRKSSSKAIMLPAMARGRAGLVKGANIKKLESGFNCLGGFFVGAVEIISIQLQKMISGSIRPRPFRLTRCISNSVSRYEDIHIETLNMLARRCVKAATVPSSLSRTAVPTSSKLTSDTEQRYAVLH